MDKNIAYMQSRMADLQNSMTKIRDGFQCRMQNVECRIDVNSDIMPNYESSDVSDESSESYYVSDDIVGDYFSNDNTDIGDMQPDLTEISSSDGSSEFDIETLLNDSEFIESHVLTNKAIFDAVVNKYIEKLNMPSVPSSIGGRSSSIALTPFKKPTSLQEAKSIVDNYFGWNE